MLKIFTLNLNYLVEKHGPWEDRRNLIVETISDSNPDIIAFQAVAKEPNKNEGLDQAMQIACFLPEYKHHFFQPANVLENGREEGNAIISKLEIANKDYIKLSLREGSEDSSPRVLLRTRFDLPTGPFYLYNGHFSWVGEQAQDNVDEAISLMSSTSEKSLLVGDLNTPPDSNIFNPFRKKGWVDTWEKFHPKEEGFTYESNNLFTRIDYGWANSLLNEKVQSIDVVKKERGSSVRLSDHLGVLISLSI